MRSGSNECRIAACVFAAVLFGTLDEGAAQDDAVSLPNGVEAVWDLEQAYRESTNTREQICINGLWRWQPAQEDSDRMPDAYHVPDANWG